MIKISQKTKDFIIDYGLYIIIIVGILGFVIAKLIINNIENNKVYEYNPEVNINEYNQYTYGKNEYKVISASEMDYVYSYYNDFKYMIYNTPEKSYEYLTKNYKSKFKDLNAYLDYVKNNYRTITLRSSTISEYKKVTGGYLIIDTAGYEYFFQINEIWNYKVEIKGIA